MKKILWGGGGLIVLLVAIVLVGPGLVNWNDYKSEITKQVKALTGRDLQINGDIQIAVLPAPAILVNDVVVSNIQGASTDNMLRLKSAEVRIALGPLLGGQVKVETVKLVEPVIVLEVLPGGRKNWVLKTPEETPPADTPTGNESSENQADGTSGPAFVLENFTIENGTLIYRDPASAIDERIEAINGQIAAASLKGPFQVIGSMTAHNVPFTYRVNVGEIIQGRTVPLNVKVGVAPDQASFQIIGTVLGLSDNPRFKGSIKGGGKNLAALIKSISGQPVPELLAQTFDLEAQVFGSEKGGEIKELTASLAESRITGDIAVELGQKTDFAARLSATRLDIDKWLKVANQKPVKSVKTGKQARVVTALPSKAAADVSRSAEPYKIVIPDTLSGSLIVSVDTVEYRGGIVRDFLLSADIANSEMTLSQLSAQFPGGSDISVFGTLSTTGGSPNFAGDVETTVNDLRGVLAWLGEDISGIPSDRLRKMALNSKFNITPQQVQVSGIDLRFDSSRLTGAATIALRKRPSLGVNLLLDRINADAYLPKSGLKTNRSEKTTKAKSGDVKTASKSRPQPSKKPKSSFSGLSVLGTFDANIKARVKTLVYKGEQINDAIVDATLYDGDIELRRLSVARIAGAKTSISGKLNNLTGLPSASGLRVQASSKNLAPLMKLAGADIALDMKKLGYVSVDTQINGNLLKPKIKSLITVAGARVSVDGRLSSLSASDMFDLNVSAKHKDIARLARAFGSDYRPSGKTGGLNLSFQAKGNPKSVSLRGIQGNIGNVTLGGDAAINLKGARPHLSANLKTGAIAVDPFLPARRKAGLEDRGWGGVQIKPVAWSGSALKGKNPMLHLAAKRGRWSPDPIDLSILNAFDADISLESPIIIVGKYLVEKADVSAVIKDGVLSTRRFSGNLFGGTLALNAQVAAGRSNQITSTVKVRGIKIAKALRAVIGEAAADGKLNVDLDLKTAGRSVSDFVASLAGDGTFDMKDVDVSKKTKGSIFAGVYGLVSALNQFGASKQGERADVSGSFKILNGVARSNDLKLSSGLGNGSATGAVDLPNWNMQVDGEVTLVQSALTQLLQAKLRRSASAVPFSVSGPLDDPKVNVDMGAALGSKVPIPGADLLLNKAPKELQGLLKGILGGGAATQQSSSPPPIGSGGQTGDTPPPPRSTQPQTQQQKTVINPQDLLKQLFK